MPLYNDNIHTLRAKITQSFPIANKCKRRTNSIKAIAHAT